MTELRLLAAAFRSRSPLPPLPGCFTTTRTSRMNQLLVTIVVLTLFEAPALHLVLHGWPTHLIVLGLHVYGFLWLLGDARLMRESGHRLGNALEIHLGARKRGLIPYAQIHSARLISDGKRGGITPFDPPNVEVELKAPATLTGYFGLRRTLSTLRLYVDEPERFVAQLMGSAASSAHSCLPPESASPQ
jgi:hypothetical protein